MENLKKSDLEELKTFYNLNKYCFKCLGINYKDIIIYQNKYKIKPKRLLRQIKRQFEIKSRDYLFDLFYKVDINPEDDKSIKLIGEYIKNFKIL